MDRGQENKENHRSVTISFGTLFSVIGTSDKSRVDVVIDIGEGDWFESARIHKTNEGRMFKGVGTVELKAFGQVLGQLTNNEVIEAARLGWGKHFSKEMQDDLEQLAQKGSREIVLSQK